MAEDASLDDFLPTDESDDEQGDSDQERAETATEVAAPDASGEEAASDDAGAADGPAVDPSSVELATTTYGWSSEATDCERCGEPVDRRWRDGDTLVCVDCKEW